MSYVKNNNNNNNQSLLLWEGTSCPKCDPPDVAPVATVVSGYDLGRRQVHGSAVANKCKQLSRLYSGIWQSRPCCGACDTPCQNLGTYEHVEYGRGGHFYVLFLSRSGRATRPSNLNKLFVLFFRDRYSFKLRINPADSGSRNTRDTWYTIKV